MVLCTPRAARGPFCLRGFPPLRVVLLLGASFLGFWFWVWLVGTRHTVRACVRLWFLKEKGGTGGRFARFPRASRSNIWVFFFTGAEGVYGPRSKPGWLGIRWDGLDRSVWEAAAAAAARMYAICTANKKDKRRDRWMDVAIWLLLRTWDHVMHTNPWWRGAECALSRSLTRDVECRCISATSCAHHVPSKLPDRHTPRGPSLLHRILYMYHVRHMPPSRSSL